MLGFRGHFVTKSRGYSTTLGALREARAAYRAEQDAPAAEDEDSTLVVGAWEYVGSGYLNPGDALLAAGVEASIRTGREAVLDARRLPKRLLAADQRQLDVQPRCSEEIGLPKGLLAANQR
jgi:replication initiator protein RepSA